MGLFDRELRAGDIGLWLLSQRSRISVRKILAGENGRPGLVPAVPIMFSANVEMMELKR